VKDNAEPNISAGPGPERKEDTTRESRTNQDPEIRKTYHYENVHAHIAGKTPCLDSGCKVPGGQEIEKPLGSCPSPGLGRGLSLDKKGSLDA